MADFNGKHTGEQIDDLLDKIPKIERLVNSHNKKLEFFAIEPVTVIVDGVATECAANEVSTVFVGDKEFEVIPTSNSSIQSLFGYPIPLTWYDWLEGVDVFENIIFDMNNLDTYKHWIQYYQGDYHVQKAQYSNCVFWSDKPYTHSPFEERTNYTIYYSAELPMCYSTIPNNTYKPFYLAYGVKTDPNWNNPDYVNSYSIVSGATQTFSYYGATAIGIFDMGVDVIKLPKDCRGLMYHAPAITHAGVFDAINTTNFGAKKGSWQEAFGDCISLTNLYIKNLKASINISWSPINIEALEFIITNAANTSAITISLSPYTWYRLTDAIRELATSKNITLALITTNYSDDTRWVTKQDTLVSGENIKTVNGQSILGSGDLPIDLSGYATTEALDGKVDKIDGKQLSTEDFTTILKQKLDGLSNYDDTTISQAVDKLRTDLDALVSGDTTTAIKTFNEVIAFLDGIQDSQDLSSIISSIEQQIAGKMDSVTLAKVATSGSYNDLADKPTIPAEQVNADWNATSGKAKILNKPTIPSAVTESTVSGWGFTKNTGTYSKPEYGIPKTDLDQEVNDILHAVEVTDLPQLAADVASVVEITNDLNTDVSQLYEEKQDALVSGTNIKTINGDSLLGSGNISISGGGSGTITGVSANGTSIATSGVANIPAASTSAYGVTKLTTATNSTSTTLAATASAVKSAYDLANSYKGTVTAVKVNGSSKSPSSGTVDIGNVVTSVKVNGSTYSPSSGVVDLGTISGGGTSGGDSSPRIVELTGEDIVIDAEDNVVYLCGTLSSLTIYPTEQINEGIVVRFYIGNNDFTLQTGDILWANGVVPVFETYTDFELSITSNINGELLAVLTPFKFVE